MPHHQHERQLPAAGITALFLDGHDVAVIARAHDVSAAEVKRMVISFIWDIVRQAGMQSVARMHLRTDIRTYAVFPRLVAEWKHCSWEAFLNQRECMEVIESRAYMSAYTRFHVSATARAKRA